MLCVAVCYGVELLPIQQQSNQHYYNHFACLYTAYELL